MGVGKACSAAESVKAEKALETLKEGAFVIVKLNMLIMLGDSLQNGWQMVGERVDNALIKDDEDEKKVRRAERKCGSGS